MIGAAVNLAAKLEKHNKRLGVRALATASAYDLARAQGYAPPIPPRRLPAQAVDGLGEPLDLVVLAG